MTDAQIFELMVSGDAAGLRLDRWLTDNVPDMSRSRVQALISEGQLSGPLGIVEDASRKIHAGETYTLSVPPPIPAEPSPEDIPLNVLYEDEYLIVIDKPPGLVVHPASGHATGTLVHALLHHCKGSLSGIGGVTRPGIVHRLDKDTSGVMVCAKSDVAHRGLVEQFQVHSIDRAYMAVVWGMPTPPQGRIKTRIGRDPHNRKRMAVVTSGGKEAITDYKVLRPVGSVGALVDCHLFTGRTHQIRVHMLSIGNSLIGDPIYLPRSRSKRMREPDIHEKVSAYKYQALQAYRLGFVHPISGQEMKFEINLSKDIETLINSLDQI